MTNPARTPKNRGRLRRLLSALALAGITALCAACGSPAGSGVTNGFGGGGGGGGGGTETVTLYLEINGETIEGSGTSVIYFSYPFTTGDRDWTPSVSLDTQGVSLAGRTITITLTGSDLSTEITAGDRDALKEAIANAAGVTVTVSLGGSLAVVASYTTVITSVAVSNIGGTNAGTLETDGTATELCFTSFGAENTSIPDVSAHAAGYITGKPVTVTVPGDAAAELSFGWAARVKRALIDAGATSVTVVTARTPVFKEADMIDVTGNPANMNTGINDGKVFREFTDGQEVFAGFTVRGNGTSTPFYLEGSSNVKVEDLLRVHPSSIIYLKVKNFGLKVAYSYISASSITVNGKWGGAITPTDLDDAFADLGIDWSTAYTYIPVTMNDIELMTAYSGFTDINLVDYPKTWNYLDKSLKNNINDLNGLDINTGYGFFRYKSTTVPYAGNEPSADPTVAQLSGDLALWMLSKGINITNVKIGSPSIIEPKSLAATLTNVVLGKGYPGQPAADNWKNQSFSTVGLNGVVTFNGDLPTNSLSIGTNLWLVINGDVGSTAKAMNKARVLELGNDVVNINNITWTGTENPNSVRVYTLSQYKGLHSYYKDSNNISSWFYNKEASADKEYKFVLNNTMIGDETIKSKSQDVYNSKEDFANNVSNPPKVSIGSVSTWNGGCTYVP